jgi:hypothetical protein
LTLEKGWFTKFVNSPSQTPLFPRNKPVRRFSSSVGMAIFAEKKKKIRDKGRSPSHEVNNLKVLLKKLAFNKAKIHGV